MTREQNIQDQSQPLTDQGASSAVRAKQETAAFDPMTGERRPDANGKSLMEQVKSTAGQAYDSAAEKASTKLEEQKGSLAGGLMSVAGSVRKMGDSLQGGETPKGIAKVTSEYSDTAAQKIEQAARYFENNDLKAMYSDVESFARKNPMVVVGGAFVVGLLAARFFKSSRPKSRATAAGQNYDAAAKSYENGEDWAQSQHSSNPTGF